ncbi:MAG: hypothetical protein IK077_17245 [Thermoguttaceae bacterium]|nr:hypothetical protein [Thermoguttaceae bacterium]
MSRDIIISAIIGFVIVATGCSGGGQASVSGKVTLGGAPLATGTLNFAPNGSGTPTGASVKDGVYKIPAKPGIAPGSYKVTCNSFAQPSEEEMAAMMAGKGGNVSLADAIPASWNANGITVEIKKGKNSFDVDIPAQ